MVGYTSLHMYAVWELGCCCSSLCPGLRSGCVCGACYVANQELYHRVFNYWAQCELHIIQASDRIERATYVHLLLLLFFFFSLSLSLPLSLCICAFLSFVFLSLFVNFGLSLSLSLPFLSLSWSPLLSSHFCSQVWEDLLKTEGLNVLGWKVRYSPRRAQKQKQKDAFKVAQGHAPIEASFLFLGELSDERVCVCSLVCRMHFLGRRALSIWKFR